MIIEKEVTMKLSEIIEMWQTDAPIDTTNIIRGSANVPLLHAKYARLHTLERIQLRKMEAEYKKYKLRKEEFFINPNEEDIREFGWKIPARGKIMKQDLDRYTEGDDDLVQKELDIGVQQEKVEFLKSIVQQIAARGFIYKNIIEEKRFQNGG